MLNILARQKQVYNGFCVKDIQGLIITIALSLCFMYSQLHTYFWHTLYYVRYI